MYDLGEVNARFWAKVLIGAADECWPWQNSKRGAYGIFWCPQEKRLVPATYYLLKYVQGEELVSGHRGMHSCDNPPCVNPAHVTSGTQKQNLDDMVLKGRHHNQKATCIRGHNRWSAGTRRRCLDCRSIYG